MQVWKAAGRARCLVLVSLVFVCLHSCCLPVSHKWQCRYLLSKCACLYVCCWL